jgi:uncharacterized damage-inducible protein DinB
MDERFLTPLADYPEPIAQALAVLEETRARTLKEVAALDQLVLDWIPHYGRNSIGTLLYHIPAIELSYLYEDILQTEFPAGVFDDHFPHPVRDEEGMLTCVTGETLAQHLARLAHVRGLLLKELRSLTVEEFTRPRAVEDYTITPQWALMHLALHESEHRGHIQEVMRSAEIKL